MISLASCFIASADKRGVAFEKDGLIYTIASEYVIKKRNVGRTMDGPVNLILNLGEVYVSGVTANNCAVRIPTTVKFPTSYCKSKEDTATYNVMGIGERAFQGAVLKNLIIPHGLKFIGEEAFKDLTITDGVLIVPPVRRMKANVFDGVNAKVLITEFQDTYTEDHIPTVFVKTFQHKGLLPEIYIPHNSYSSLPTSLNSKDIYTVGNDLCDKWIKKMLNSVKEDSLFQRTIKTRATSRYQTYRSFSIGSQSMFYTFKGSSNVPTVTVRRVVKFDKAGTDIDMLAPFEYICWNPYTQQKDVIKEFAMDGSIYRIKKGDTYLYFSLDGKPLTDVNSLLDSSGKDPFGMQVKKGEEKKENKAAKDRETELNNKINGLKNLFGF